MIKKLAKNVGEYKKQAILTPVMVALEVIVECLIPFVMSKLITIIEQGANLKNILAVGGVLIGMAMLSLFLGVMSGKFCAIASCGFAKNLRQSLYSKVQTFSFSNIDKFSASSLVTRLTTDVSRVQQAFMMIIRIAVRVPFMFVSSICMVIFISPKIALLFAVAIPVLVIALALIIFFAMPTFNKVFKKYDKVNESIQENVKGMRCVKSYVREDYEIKKFNEKSDELKKDFTKAERIVALNGPVMNFTIFAVMLCICYLGSKIIIESGATALNVGQLSSLLVYSSQILSSLMMLSMIFVMITMSIASCKRIVEVLDEEPDIQNNEKALTEIKNGSIEFKNVSFKYDKTAEKYALSDVNLKIESGQTIGIIGGTGSSKTTFVNLISRLYDVTEGILLVGGKNVKDYDLVTLRDNVAVVLQKNVLFSGTIKENLRWGKNDATDEEMKRVCEIAQADEYISKFENGYDTYIEQGGANLSGGQRQRMCIARALLKNPKILIFDDSTSAVDTRTDALIRKALKSEAPDVTKIIIAQRISSIENADKIIVLDGGKVVGFGTSEELRKTNDIYSEIYDIQNKLGGDK